MKFPLFVILVLVSVLIAAYLPGASGSTGYAAPPPLLGPVPSLVPAARAPGAAPAPAFGPQLLLVRVTPGRDAALANLPLVPHARLAVAPGLEALYLASGTAAAVTTPPAGINLQVLDPDTADQAYYLVDATTPSAAGFAAQAGRILYADALQLVLALPAAEQAARLSALLAQSLAVAAVDPARLASGQAAAAPIPSRGPTAADPAIAALLETITADQLNGFMADLSGVRPVDLGGRSVTFTSRYLLAAHTANVEEYLYRYYSALGLTTGYVNWSYGSYHGRNVIAEIPGAQHPERLWLVGGHFDSNSNQPTVSAPGADDNGSGLASTMALAAVLRGHQFADTIRFVNFGAEEFGEWGSKSYAAALSGARAQVMGYIDLDMIGYDGNRDRVIELHTGTAAASVALGQAFASAVTRYGQGLTCEIKQASASNFSDHSSFWKYGYPSVLGIENFYDDAIPRDRNPWYHNTGDLLNRVDTDYVLRYARSALALVAELAGMATGPVPSPTLTPTATETTTTTPDTTETATMTPVPTAGASPTPLPPPEACRELVSDGGFEAASGWTFLYPDRAYYTDQVAHAGARAARFGLLPGQALAPPPPGHAEVNLLGQVAAAGATFATGYQTVDIPADADRVTLTYWYKPGTEATSGDYQDVWLLRSNYQPLQQLIKVLQHSADWLHGSSDLAAYRGQRLVLYFETYNDGLGGRTWLYLDDVSLQACHTIPLRPGAYLPLLLKEHTPP